MQLFEETLNHLAAACCVQGMHPEVFVSEPGKELVFCVQEPLQMVPFNSWLTYNPFACLARGLYAISGETISPEWACGFDPVMRNDVELIDDRLTCPSSIGHHFPTILDNLRADPYPLLPQNFLLPSGGHKPGIRADAICFSATHDKLHMSVYISWADLTRVPILYTQLAMLLDVAAHSKQMRVGVMNIHFVSVCCLETVQARHKASSGQDPSLRLCTNDFPAHEFPDVNVVEEVRMVVGNDKPPMGLKWTFLRKVAMPMLQAHGMLQSDDAGRFDKAIRHMQSTMPANNEWLRAGVRWVNEQRNGTE